ncbi:hypothetical protein PoB_006223000 [Plakobranchus ocellatus]|uniref:Uncharacterized protein n=1 Tax=Plakobranchus ocellatus TaxID=259542 RepID=A0AAV4CV28_9GAST|nr:hypothetical protein PoB_006223000 [Plakobranchus ocellatus]
MATSNDLLIKQRSVIEFLAAEGCSAANISDFPEMGTLSLDDILKKQKSKKRRNLNSFARTYCKEYMLLSRAEEDAREGGKGEDFEEKKEENEEDEHDDDDEDDEDDDDDDND